MARFMFIANYQPEGAKGLLSVGGTARRAAIEKSVADLGGHIETFDFAFGADDAYTVIDLPSNEAAAALALTISAAGRVRVRTVVLLTPEEIDEAAHLKFGYEPPGA
jgi:Uncharacterized conserved protein